MGPEADQMYLVKIVWIDGTDVTILTDTTELMGSWHDWHTDFIAKASHRPGWFKLGNVSFHSQNVRYIQRIETVEPKEND